MLVQFIEKKMSYSLDYIYIKYIYTHICYIYITIYIINIYYIVLVLYYINLICFKKCKTVVFASLTSADSRKIRKSDPTGGNAFAPKRDVKFLAKKGGVNL